MRLGKILAVFLFEWRRSLTLPRLSWWLALAMFPVLIVVLIQLSAAEPVPPEPWMFFFFAMVPMLITMLGAYLWTAPAVSAELERKSWVYLASRPHGTSAVVLGKYLAAITWVLPAALVGLSLALALARTGFAWEIWTTIARLTCLSCPAYAAIYLVLGILSPKRAMVVAVAYTLVFELIVSLVPAIINKLTVQYRIRALLVDWGEISFGDGSQFNAMELIGDAPAWHHVTILVAYTLTALAIAVVVVRRREFSLAQEVEGGM